MHDDDGFGASADQDAWIALVRAAREQMGRLVPLMGAMGPGEIKVLVDAMGELQNLHYRAATMDRCIELSNARAVHSD